MATILDPELMLGLCRKFNGYDGAVKYLAESGLTNPDTGKPYTKHAVRYTARKAKGFEAWRRQREEERADVQTEFARIAKLALATKRKKAAAEK